MIPKALCNPVPSQPPASTLTVVPWGSSHARPLTIAQPENLEICLQCLTLSDTSEMPLPSGCLPWSLISAKNCSFLPLYYEGTEEIIFPLSRDICTSAFICALLKLLSHPLACKLLWLRTLLQSPLQCLLIWTLTKCGLTESWKNTSH